MAEETQNQQEQKKPVKKALEPEPEKQQFNSFLCGLFRDVLNEVKPMQIAEKMVREEVEAMSAEELRVWKENAPALARRMMAVAEGFSQVIVVTGSRQWGQ